MNGNTLWVVYLLRRGLCPLRFRQLMVDLAFSQKQNQMVLVQPIDLHRMDLVYV